VSVHGHKVRHRLAAAAAVAGVLVALTACSTSSTDDPGTTPSGSASTTTAVELPDPAKLSGDLVVWVDATREKMAKEYAAARPNLNVKITTYDPSNNFLQTRLNLLKNKKAEWPDVVFTPSGDAATLVGSGFPNDIGPLVPEEIKKGFGATLPACISGGSTLCLPGDISTQMLWYNAKLFKEFGYEVPKTWDEYSALAQKVATEHPGYVVGSCGDLFCANVFYNNAGCPAPQLDAPEVVTVNTTDERCARVTNMLDPLLANKTVSTSGPFDPDFGKLGSEGKVLMLPGFVWMGKVLFNDIFKMPSGEIAGTVMPSWGDGKEGLGAAVGAQWIMSSASQNPDAALDMVVWESTDPVVLLNMGFPAYEPAAPASAAAAAKDGFFAVDPAPAMIEARAQVTTPIVNLPFSGLGPFQSVVAPEVKAGKTLASQMEAWQQATIQAAEDAGYSVANS
jgi:multiple sugar transport system substrate-binding protein